MCGNLIGIMFFFCCVVSGFVATMIQKHRENGLKFWDWVVCLFIAFGIPLVSLLIFMFTR